jgi:hypothetical protein
MSKWGVQNGVGWGVRNGHFPIEPGASFFDIFDPILVQIRPLGPPQMDHSRYGFAPKWVPPRIWTPGTHILDILAHLDPIWDPPQNDTFWTPFGHILDPPDVTFWTPYDTFWTPQMTYFGPPLYDISDTSHYDIYTIPL